MKSNKARIAKQRRQTKAARDKKPWTMMGVAFCLGAIVTAGAFVLTPLGALCVTSDKTPAASVSKKRDKDARGDADANRVAAGPLANTGKHPKHPAIPEPGDPAGAGRSDPLAELQRVREINEHNRKLMEAAAARRGQSQAPKPLVPQPPKPIIPGQHPTPTPPRQPGL